MDKAYLQRLNEWLAKQDTDGKYLFVDPDEIDMSRAFDIDKDYFWNHHGKSKDDYRKMMEDSCVLYEAINNNADLSTLLSFRHSNRMACNFAYTFFDRRFAVTVNRDEAGELSISYDGRHRIMMARELGMPLPVRIVDDMFVPATSVNGRKVPDVDDIPTGDDDDYIY